MKKFFDMLSRAIDCKVFYDSRQNYYSPLTEIEAQELINKIQSDRVLYTWF